jgi:hypothetical protein
MNGEIEQGIESCGGVLEWRPRPTPGCSAIEEEEEEEYTEALVILKICSVLSLIVSKLMV